jgi:ion channel
LNLKFFNPYRFRVLLGILLVVYAILPFFEKRLFTDLMSTIILIFGLSAISNSRIQLIACSLVALLAIAAIWLSRWFPGKQLNIGGDGLDILFLILVICAILSNVFRSREITTETLAGAICAYLLIGALWADTFSVLETVRPGSFSSVAVASDTISSVDSARIHAARFSYFSFVTLSTLGYGDITPLTRPARNLAALEAIFGQLYLAVLIARLVSQQGTTNLKSNG